MEEILNKSIIKTVNCLCLNFCMHTNSGRVNASLLHMHITIVIYINLKTIESAPLCLSKWFLHELTFMVSRRWVVMSVTSPNCESEWDCSTGNLVDIHIQRPTCKHICDPSDFFLLKPSSDQISTHFVKRSHMTYVLVTGLGKKTVFLMRKSIVFNSLTSMPACIHQTPPPPPSQFAFSNWSVHPRFHFHSRSVSHVSHCLCMLRCFSTHLTLIYRMCQMKCHWREHTGFISVWQPQNMLQ